MQTGHQLYRTPLHNDAATTPTINSLDSLHVGGPIHEDGPVNPVKHWNQRIPAIGFGVPRYSRPATPMEIAGRIERFNHFYSSDGN